MLFLEAVALRRLGDDVQPALVEVEIVDAARRAHRVVHQTSAIAADDRPDADARYPIPVRVACRPRGHGPSRPGPRDGIGVDLSPWGYDVSPWKVGAAARYTVERQWLSWAEPAVHSDLSVAARQAVALVTFRRWREAVGLESAECDALEDHLWTFATTTPDTFDDWYDSQFDADLVHLDETDPLPASVRAFITAASIDESSMRAVLGSLTEITHGGLFGGIGSEASLGELEAVSRFTAEHGVPLVPADAFTDSLWIDHAWGRPSAEVVARWRAV